MTVKYSPITKVSIDHSDLQFNEKRDVIRKRLAEKYFEDNEIIELGEDVDPIFRRRDIYENINSSENYFFLNYDNNDLLRDIEVHYCDKVQVFDIIFDFNDQVDRIGLELMRYSENNTVNTGEYFFADLQIVIMSKYKMGGEGSTIGYFYCSSDITHLVV